MGTERLAVVTVRRTEPKRQKPAPAPKQTRQTRQSAAVRVARDIVHEQVPSRNSITYGGDVILSYYVGKPRVDGDKIVANLMYTTYKKNNLEEMCEAPFRFLKEELMQCVPMQDASARLKMLHEILLIKEARRAEIQEYLKEFLKRRASESWSQKCDSLKRELNDPRTNLQPKLKNMTRFEVLYRVLINPRLYL